MAFFLLWLSLFALINCSAHSEKYYFCTDDGLSISRMFSITKDDNKRILKRDSYHDSFPVSGTLVGSYDEKDRVISTYKQKWKTGGTTYFLWVFVVPNNKLYLDIVSKQSKESFQKDTGLSPIPENIKKYNVKPELFKYVPDKKSDPSVVYMTFTKWTFNCNSMGYLRYKLRRALYIVYDMLASMG